MNSNDPAEYEGETPHPEDCDHKWLLKGGTQSSALGVTLWQCEKCGLARSKSLSSGMGVQDLNSGWNPKPEPEKEEEDESSGGWLFG